MTGGHIAHPLLISLANIKMATRNKVSSHAFLLTVLLPIAKFVHLVKWMQSVLGARFVHQCLNIVLELLKQAAHIGQMMSDPFGNLRYCFTPLASYIVDTPEACMLACVQGKTSLVTMAMYENFGDAFQHSPRTAKTTLKQLLSIPLTMFQHFKDGISKLKQVTGRAQHDMQCYIVALIADAAPRKVVIAVRALMDFHYLSQVTMIDEAHCQKILNALKEFHKHKQGIIACGARQGAKSKQVLNN
ncbi:hypothetical protein EDD22DRAFT_958954 [Suillus occidentalis]|nr:hypothetical protein EDD22DRAFT_958954 [Suillus occidentalis]